MIKLNKQVESLENVIEKIEQKIEELEEKKYAIEENAADEDREMTDAEWNRFYKLKDQIEELQGEADEIQKILRRLKEVIKMEAVYINGRRDGYSPEQCGKTMTVAELIEMLSEFDEDAPVYIKNDNGYTYGRITPSDITANDEE